MSNSAPLPEQPFISHLVELRDRLMRAVLAILAIFLVLAPFGNDIYLFVAEPLMQELPEGTNMIATQVASPFLAPFKLALVAAVFIAMPYLLYQLWSFIAPGLYQHEKRLAFPLLASSVLLFYLGAAFAYFVVFPLVFAFMTGTTPEGIPMMPDITHYLDFVLTLFFAFGIAFEVPIATIMLVLAGATTPEKLAGKRPYVIVGAFVIGMLLTPPDIVSQTLLALPMWVLFEIGLLLSRVVARDRARVRAAREAAENDGPEAAAVATAAPATGGDPEEGSFRPLDEHEMDQALDQIEQTFDALDQASAEASVDDQADEASDAPGDTPAPQTHAWSADDSADMLDEEDAFPSRSATEALVDAKLEQVVALRETGAFDEARRLLYEVLSEGNDTQVGVARNILEQLDS